MVTHQTACLFNRHVTLLEDSVTQGMGRLGSGLGTRALNPLIILSHVYQFVLYLLAVFADGIFLFLFEPTSALVRYLWLTWHHFTPGSRYRGQSSVACCVPNT